MPATSSEGRYVVSRSFGTNLVADDTNKVSDIFVRDTLLQTTTRISVSSTHAQANDSSYFPDISADGRFVTFNSIATNLVANDNNSIADVFVYELGSGQTGLISFGPGAAPANNSSNAAKMSADGRFVAYLSEATNLISGDTNGWIDVFVYDTVEMEIFRVTVASDGTQGNGYTGWFDLSGKGITVVFESAANNLVAGDTNFDSDIFRHHYLIATTQVYLPIIQSNP